MGRPTLKFVAGRGEPTRQLESLKEWWSKHQDSVFDAMDYYVKCKWQGVKCIEVHIERMSRKGSKTTTHWYNGFVGLDRPRRIHLSLGRRVRWTKNSLRVFVHELIHCATILDKDRRFKSAGLLEFWVLDELATDLLAQYILKDVMKCEPDIRRSIRYALEDTANEIARDKELHDKLVKNVQRELNSYLKTEKKKFRSFRKNLKNA